MRLARLQCDLILRDHRPCGIEYLVCEEHLEPPISVGVERIRCAEPESLVRSDPDQAVAARRNNLKRVPLPGFLPWRVIHAQFVETAAAHAHAAMTCDIVDHLNGMMEQT